MNGVITCSVKEAVKLMEHLNEDDMITLTIIDKKSHIIHSQPKRIKKKNGENLIDNADSIEYQDNEIFGRLSLYGVTSEKNLIHNLLFPQLEWCTNYWTQIILAIISDWQIQTNVLLLFLSKEKAYPANDATNISDKLFQHTYKPNSMPEMAWNLNTAENAMQHYYYILEVS